MNDIVGWVGIAVSVITMIGAAIATSLNVRLKGEMNVMRLDLERRTAEVQEGLRREFLASFVPVTVDGAREAYRTERMKGLEEEIEILRTWRHKVASEYQSMAFVIEKLDDLKGNVADLKGHVSEIADRTSGVDHRLSAIEDVLGAIRRG